MIVREFLTRLGFEADDRKVKSFDDRVRQLRNGLVLLVGAATTASAAAFKLANDTARYGDQLSKTADRLGITTDALERLRFAAERSGVQQQTLEMALQRMTRRLSEAAAGGGEAQKAIQELGLDAQALGNMTPDQAMNTLADALSGVENQSERVRLAFKFFDSEGVALLNMIGEGSEEVRRLGEEFERLSGGLTGDQSKAAVVFTDAMTDMQIALKGLRLQIGAQLMPVFQPMIEAFTEFLVVNRELILERVHRAFEIMIDVMRTLGRLIGGVVDGFQFLAGILQDNEGTAILLATALATIASRFGLIRRVLRIFLAALVLDDIIAWVNGQDSLIEKLLGSYEEFGEKVQWVIDKMGGLERAINIVLGLALARWAWGASFGFFALFSSILAVTGALSTLNQHPLIRLLTGVALIGDRINNLVEGARDLRSKGGTLDQMLGADEGETLGQSLYRWLRDRIGLEPRGDDQRSEPEVDSDGVIQLPEMEVTPRDGFKPDLPMSREELDALRENMSFEPSFGPQMPATTTQGGDVNTVTLDANINITVPPGSSRENAEYIATRVRDEMQREINRAGTALET